MEKCFRYAVQVWYLEENYHRTISFIETFGRYLWIPSSVHMCVPGNSTVAVAQATAKRSSISSSVMSFASIYANPATIASPAPWRPLTSTGGTAAFHAPLGLTSMGHLRQGKRSAAFRHDKSVLRLHSASSHRFARYGVAECGEKFLT